MRRHVARTQRNEVDRQICRLRPFKYCPPTEERPGNRTARVRRRTPRLRPWAVASSVPREHCSDGFPRYCKRALDDGLVFEITLVDGKDHLAFDDRENVHIEHCLDAVLDPDLLHCAKITTRTVLMQDPIHLHGVQLDLARQFFDFVNSLRGCPFCVLNNVRPLLAKRSAHRWYVNECGCITILRLERDCIVEYSAEFISNTRTP